MTEQVLMTMPQDQVEEYWMNKVESLRREIESQSVSDPLSVSFLELMEEAISHDQYVKTSDYSRVTRMVRIRMRMPRKLIEQLFNVKTTSVYYTGLYIPMEGLLVSEGLRYRSHYDHVNQKGVWFDLASHMPDWFKDEYEERLSIPAMGGLFVPKKSAMTQSGYLTRANQLQFFDIMQG